MRVWSYSYTNPIVYEIKKNDIILWDDLIHKDKYL